MWLDLSSIDGAPNATSTASKGRKIAVLVMIDTATKTLEREWIRIFGPRSSSVWMNGQDGAVTKCPSRQGSMPLRCASLQDKLLRKSLSLFMALDGLHKALSWTVPCLNQSTFVNGYTPMIDFVEDWSWKLRLSMPALKLRSTWSSGGQCWEDSLGMTKIFNQENAACIGGKRATASIPTNGRGQQWLSPFRQTQTLAASTPTGWHMAQCSPSKPTACSPTCERRWIGQWITTCRTSTSWPSPTTGCSHSWPSKDQSTHPRRAGTRDQLTWRSTRPSRSTDPWARSTTPTTCASTTTTWSLTPAARSTTPTTFSSTTRTWFRATWHATSTDKLNNKSTCCSKWPTPGWHTDANRDWSTTSSRSSASRWGIWATWFPAVHHLRTCEIQHTYQLKEKLSDNNDVALNSKRPSGWEIVLRLFTNALKANSNSEPSVHASKIKNLRCTLISFVEEKGKNPRHCPKDGTLTPKHRSSILAALWTAGATRMTSLSETMFSAEPTLFRLKNFQFLKTNFKPPLAWLCSVDQDRSTSMTPSLFN